MAKVIKREWVKTVTNRKSGAKKRVEVTRYVCDYFDADGKIIRTVTTYTDTGFIITNTIEPAR